MFLSVGLGGAMGALSGYGVNLLISSMEGQSGWMPIKSVNVAGSAYLVAYISLSLAGFYAGFLLLRLFMGQG